MLGLVKPYKMEMLVKDCMYYKLYYCSVCRNLVRSNNRLYAFVNSYEAAFLAMLYNEMVVHDMGAVKDRCSGLPLVKVPALPPDHEAVELGAALSLLAFQVKFQDDLHDETGFWIKKYNRFLAGRLKKTFKGQIAQFEKFNIDLDVVQKEQDKLNRMERDPSLKDIDLHLSQWGELFSYIMSQPFRGKIEPDRHEVLARWFDHLGRILYLLDSMEDLHKDLDSEEFNLILRAEDNVESANENWLKTIYNRYQQRVHEQRMNMLELLPRLELNESHSIVSNILTHGLDRQCATVFDALVSKKPKTQKLLFNCQDF
ncbi:MAG: hypothetical protein G3M70_12435 [Candidatus Nitronauta litoralis]|uniref:Uncharacterized protein n=1 Tax=Candidatus Nitronauta litoralis TaxID=2705533 RepID=A0A7T0BXF2_9BACT|nr:MAG: hypothetical protein G3M70_12435 [Candidatus Nitronauta litoralis]